VINPINDIFNSMSTHPQVDHYFSNKTTEVTQPICKVLREICLELGLEEQYKWSRPCYSYQGLVCSIGSFKKHVGLWIFKGSELSDPEGHLVKAQEATKAMRHLRYTHIDQVDRGIAKDFIQQAMRLNQ